MIPVFNRPERGVGALRLLAGETYYGRPSLSIDRKH